MTREIKFRAWSIEHKKMLPVHDAKFVNGQMIGAKGIGWDDTVEVMQFTGLLDKNGKEIYEGDILQYENPNSPKEGAIRGPVTFVRGRYTIDGTTENNYFLAPSFGRHHKIIGNIHENPELITPRT